MTDRARELAATGASIVSLSAGEPDFDTPAYICDAAIEAIRRGATRYPPAAGLAELREAIATWVNAECGGAYTREEILVSVGAKQCLFGAIFTLFGPGDRVAFPAPYWVSYPAIVRLARAEPVVLETRAENGFKPEPEVVERALDEGASGIVLNSPSNPTGAILEADELDAIVEVAAERGAWVVVDEIYREIRYRPSFASIAAKAGEYERIVLIDGFSKAFAMTGWRVGFAAAPESLIRAMTRLQGHVNTNTATPSQHAALAAVTRSGERREAVSRMVAAFRERRDAVVAGVADVPGLDLLAPEGAFYGWIDARPWCAALGGDTQALCLDLLEHEGVALVPGSAFGVEGWVRLSFAADRETLDEAIGRLHAAADRLGAA